MKEIGLGEIPDDIRLKLTEEGKRLFWEKVEDRGIGPVAESYGFDRSRLYNWRNKELSIPASLVREFLEDGARIKGFKAGGRSELIYTDLPIEVSREFLTRLEVSVSTNSDGVPVYYTPERSLAERFSVLLADSFGVEPRIYSRSGQEVRFPKSISLICSSLDYRREFRAEVDEIGEIREEKVILSDRKLDPETIDKRLYSRSKRYRLALARNDSEELGSILSEEKERSAEILG
ncbi:MAG: hypothetical protein ABEJ56_01310 [Candidatus Nanohaloarchaea archaeon]